MSAVFAPTGITEVLWRHTDMTAEECSEVALVLEVKGIGYLLKALPLLSKHHLGRAYDFVVYQGTGIFARKLLADGREVF